MLAAGDLVGASYRIVRLIGQGGMGEVYEALHEPLSRRVALKKIRGDFASDELLTRFRREAEASAALGHPNIVQVTDFVLEDERSPAMVMELLEGRTLRELVSGALRLEPSRAVFISLQILSGLAAAHGAGIVHRDVKPANVFLQKTLALRDHVKLLDFGVAKLTDGDTGSKAAIPVTRRGMVLGTRAYMAPEQASGEVVDARADLYSVGATLYYALSGWKPRDSNPSEKRAPLATIAKDVPGALNMLTQRRRDGLQKQVEGFIAGLGKHINGSLETLGDRAELRWDENGIRYRIVLRKEEDEWRVDDIYIRPAPKTADDAKDGGTETTVPEDF